MLLIAFLIVGPKDLPKVARWLGRMVKRLRLLIKELKEETGWAEFEKELNDTRTDVETTLKDVERELGVPVRVVRNNGESLIRALWGMEEENG